MPFDEDRLLRGETPLHTMAGIAQRDSFGRLLYRGILEHADDGLDWLRLPPNGALAPTLLRIAPEIDLSGVPTGAEIEVAGEGCSYLMEQTPHGGRAYQNPG